MTARGLAQGLARGLARGIARGSSGGDSYDADALDYFARAEALGGSFDQTGINGTYTETHVKNAINKFVIDTKSAGVWSKITECYFLGGVSFGGLMSKLKYTSNPVLTSTGFVSGDYVAAGSEIGLAGNGTDKSLNCNFLASSLDINDSHIAARIERAVAKPGDGVPFGASSSLSDAIAIQTVTVGSTIGRAFIGRQVDSSASGSGTYIASSESSASLSIYKTGASTGSTSTATTATAINANLRLFCNGTASTSTAFSSDRISLACVGDSLTAGEVSTLSSCIDELRQSLSTLQISPASDYVFPFFQNGSESLHIAESADGIDYTLFASAVYNGINDNLRDPSLLKRGGYWYLVYSPNSFGVSQVLYIARSTNLISWSSYATVDLSSVGGATMRIWSPDWFVDDDDTVHITVACSPNYAIDSEDFQIYKIVATSADLSTWSAPVEIFDEYKAIDPFIIKESGTYYLWYKNETTKWVEVASSSLITGPFTRIRSGDWASWGVSMEGHSVLKRGTGDYVFFGDAYTTSSFRYATSTSLLSGWSALSTLSPASVGVTTIRHGTPYKFK